MTNHSNTIARLSVLLQVVRELDPDGAWQHEPLVLAYLRNHYSLTVKQVGELEIYLSQQLEHAEAAFKYKQITIFEIPKEGK